MDVLSDVGAAAAYVGIGLVVLVIGYVFTDWITPGKLSSLICDDHNVNAAVIAASNLLGTGVIVNVAIWTTHDDFAEGLLSTLVFGLVGVIILALADWIIDVLVPADLRSMITADKFQPAVAVIGISHLVIGTIIAASIV